MALNQKPELKKKLKISWPKPKDKIVAVWKPVGQTPLQTINCLRKLKPEYADLKIGYAGRLDPLAEGVLLLMIGETNKNRFHYLSLDKEYEAEVLFGISTDSHDILGLIENFSIVNLDKQVLALSLSSLVGKFNQSYPLFSSPIIAGRQKFSKEVEIYRLDLIDDYLISNQQLLVNIENSINQVKGNFRQTEIIDCWRQHLLLQEKGLTYRVVKIKIKCSSGVYIRLLAHKWGLKVGSGACLFNLKRLKVGQFGRKVCFKY